MFVQLNVLCLGNWLHAPLRKKCGEVLVFSIFHPTRLFRPTQLLIWMNLPPYTIIGYRYRFPRKHKMERQHNKSILWEFQSSRSSRTRNRQIPTEDRQVYAPTTSHSDEETDNFYNTIDKILEKQTHYTIAMGDLMRKLEDKQIHQKGRQNASAWSSEMKEETNHCLILYRHLILPDLSSKMRPCG